MNYPNQRLQEFLKTKEIDISTIVCYCEDNSYIDFEQLLHEYAQLVKDELIEEIS